MSEYLLYSIIVTGYLPSSFLGKSSQYLSVINQLKYVEESNETDYVLIRWLAHCHIETQEIKVI